jgi:cobalt-zinc-cadmium efflux system protein
MSHTHSHSHTTDFSRAFGFGIALNVIYIIVEVLYGLASNSMALIADAGHNLSDVLGLVLAWGASYLAKSAVTSSRTYGMRKSTVLAAFLNALILLIAVGAISVEAVRKIIHPEPIGGSVMMIVAGIGVLINGATALMFMKGRERDINIKGAFLHMAADAGISLGVVAAGLLINLTGFYLIDPVISIIVVLVITYGTWGLLRDSFNLSMDAVPKEIDLNKVKSCLNSLDGVKEVHDLHIWAMSTTETALTVHLVMPREHQDDQFLSNTCTLLHDKFGIEHSTIQIEKCAHAASCEEGHV